MTRIEPGCYVVIREFGTVGKVISKCKFSTGEVVWVLEGVRREYWTRELKRIDASEYALLTANTG